MFSCTWSLITFAGFWAAPLTPAAPSSGSSALPAGKPALRAPSGPCCSERRHLSLGLTRSWVCSLRWPWQTCWEAATGLRCLWKAMKIKGLRIISHVRLSGSLWFTSGVLPHHQIRSCSLVLFTGSEAHFESIREWGEAHSRAHVLSDLLGYESFESDFALTALYVSVFNRKAPPPPPAEQPALISHDWPWLIQTR